MGLGLGLGLVLGLMLGLEYRARDWGWGIGLGMGLGGSDLGGRGLGRGLARASWIILQPANPPVSWTMRIKLLLFFNSENGRTTKTLFLMGLWLGAGREGG